MSTAEILEKLLRSYSVYYDIVQEHVTEPFVAEAKFHTHEEQYFLTRSATISEAESNEYVYFAQVNHLDEKGLQDLDQKAWEAGLSCVKPHKNHRNSDVTLLIAADTVSEGVFKKVKRTRHYKSYKYSFYGWTNYRLVVFEASTGRAACNHQGSNLKKLVCNISHTL